MNIEEIALRDWFAGMALQGFLADGSQRLVNQEIVKANSKIHVLADTEAIVAAVNEQLAIGSYKLADAMLAARQFESLQKLGTREKGER